MLRMTKYLTRKSSQRAFDEEIVSEEELEDVVDDIEDEKKLKTLTPGR